MLKEFISRIFRSSTYLNGEVKPPSKVDLFTFQKAYLPKGMFPTNFSINLGVAPCTHTCLFCPQSIEKPKVKKWLELSVLEKVLSEMPYEGILLNVSSYSETMLAPNLMDSLRLMKQIRPKLSIVLASNGASITEEQVNQLIEMKLDIFQFSFDAVDKESYKKLIQCDHFEQAEKKLEMICRIKRERKSSMIIQTHIMAFKNQQCGFKKFYKKWERKVNHINFRPVGNWGDDNLLLKERLAEQGFIPVYQKPKRRYPCASIFTHFKLSCDGYYYPCVAYIPERLLRDKEYTLGDARKITFKQAWDNLNWHRDKHLDGKWDDCLYCSGCDFWGFWENMFYEKRGRFELDEIITKLDNWC